MSNTTTSLVLTADQHRLLKQVASLRMMRGQTPTASVSEVIRQMIVEHQATFEAEISGVQR